MKAGLSAAYSLFIIVLTNLGVITLIHFFVTSMTLHTAIEWWALVGVVIVIYGVGVAVSLAGLSAIERLFERNKNRAICAREE